MNYQTGNANLSAGPPNGSTLGGASPEFRTAVGASRWGSICILHGRRFGWATTDWRGSRGPKRVAVSLRKKSLAAPFAQVASGRGRAAGGVSANRHALVGHGREWGRWLTNRASMSDTIGELRRWDLGVGGTEAG